MELITREATQQLIIRKVDYFEGFCIKSSGRTTKKNKNHHYEARECLVVIIKLKVAPLRVIFDTEIPHEFLNAKTFSY